VKSLHHRTESVTRRIELQSSSACWPWPSARWRAPSPGLRECDRRPGAGGIAAQQAKSTHGGDPDAAYFDDRLGAFVLPYEAVRTSADPAQAIFEFAQSTYDAAARLQHWPAGELEPSA
jgi:hypothetical protein